MTFLATARAGWAAVCRMVSSVHLSGERGRPVATLDLPAPHLAGGDVVVLLGPSSELGAVAARLVAGVKVATQTPPTRAGRSTVLSSWLLLVRGELRRTGHRGVSVRATGAWERPVLHALWQRARTSDEAPERVRAELARQPEPAASDAGEPTSRRVLVHSSDARSSPYADVRPAGDPTRDVGRTMGADDDDHRAPSRALWHRSPGSPG